MPADPPKPSLATVADTLAALDTPDASTRRQCMEQLERWAKVGLPEGADRLILGEAGRSYQPASGYPATPNEDLIRLLWDGNTNVSVENVEAVFPSLDEACRASAMRLLAELGTRTASESLARILSQCTNGGLPKVMWPFLLPLERRPRDPDVLVPPLLGLSGETESASAVHPVLLAYAKAGMLRPEQSGVCAEIVAAQASRAIDSLRRSLTKHGMGSRWDDDYVSVKIDAGLLLDLLGRLDQPSSTPVFEDAVRAPEPWVKLWGALGLIRSERFVAPEVFPQVAEWPECRITLARELQALERSELFPRNFLNQASLAEAEMVDWLLFPTELGRAPDEIRQLQSVPVETEDGIADLYVFAFRTHPPHWLSDKDWIVGVAGPFLVSDQPTFESFGATFSRFERLADKSLEEHVEALLGTVEGSSGAED